LAGGMLNAAAAVEGEDVIAACGRGQERAQFLVMPLPMLLQNEREDCDREEKNCERSEQRRGWFKNGAHNDVNCGGGPIFSSKSESAGRVRGWSSESNLRVIGRTNSDTLPISPMRPVHVGASIVRRAAPARES